MRTDFATLYLEKRDGAGWITFNRPKRLNALDFASKWDLQAALALCVNDDAIKVIAFRGEGRAFCAGIDLTDLSAGLIDERNFRLWEECLRMIETSDKIAIACMHGHALGSGVQLALSCDLRVATRGAKIGVPAGKEGLVPGLSVMRLARFVGLGRAKEIVMWGEFMDGEEAARIGLVNRVVDDETKDEDFEKVVARTVAVATDGVRLTKRAMNEIAYGDFAEAYDIYLQCQRLGLQSGDFAKAMAAWRDRAAAPRSENAA
ncbi:enoyl-CoA hydratase/carnithine racemase [Microvirga flocculans]|uniref:Enoyl-CoA hydratase/carnithine racemase n=1 Tax=Microvirga flocculans TaxID=217168 RepID=A0A7W6N8F0_9HYPH|nr:enoyl-CoA hydratase/isomerase family protein [Microvirga flocculans]MBB4041173.1 enoyl-CoA hydratase/carnithine racemase [Microvirga flocculans]